MRLATIWMAYADSQDKIQFYEREYREREGVELRRKWARAIRQQIAFSKRMTQHIEMHDKIVQQCDQLQARIDAMLAKIEEYRVPDEYALVYVARSEHNERLDAIRDAGKEAK